MKNLYESVTDRSFELIVFSLVVGCILSYLYAPFSPALTTIEKAVVVIGYGGLSGMILSCVGLFSVVIIEIILGIKTKISRPIKVAFAAFGIVFIVFWRIISSTFVCLWEGGKVICTFLTYIYKQVCRLREYSPRTQKELRGYFALTNEVTITVPSTVDLDKKISDQTYNEIVDNVSMQMSKVFGGCTASSGKGCWVTNDGVAICESVTLCTSSASGVNFKENVAKATIIAKQVCAILNQDCVAMKVNGKMYFVTK
ncbi:MAG: hypothetical protein ACRDD8_05825 [Bacteroidales bacterium]